LFGIILLHSEHELELFEVTQFEGYIFTYPPDREVFLDLATELKLNLTHLMWIT